MVTGFGDAKLGLFVRRRRADVHGVADCDGDVVGGFIGELPGGCGWRCLIKWARRGERFGNFLLVKNHRIDDARKTRDFWRDQGGGGSA